MPHIVMPALPFVQTPLSSRFLHKIQRGMGFAVGNCGKKSLPFCISGLPILQSGREQLVDLFARIFSNEQLCEFIKRGEKWAANQLIEQNKGFVYDCAHKTYKAYRASHVLSETDEDDLTQEGLCALIAAVDSFDPTHGTLFLTCAGQAVQNAMLDWLRENNNRFELKYLKAHPDSKWVEYGAEAEQTAWQPIDMPNDTYTMTPEQIYLRKETREALEAGLENAGRGAENI